MTDPDDAHWRALVEFRARHGRAWRDTLSIYWMNGRDASEPHGAALRWIRNHLGPSWLCDLPDSDIEAQALRLRLADTLPEMCATLLPSTLEPVAIKRGEKGYWPLPGRHDSRAHKRDFFRYPGADRRNGDREPVRLGRARRRSFPL
ncbi:hypothetical protein [Sphingomonas oryzagri]